MAEIVNLRAARKGKARAAKEEAARANRILHGTPKAARRLEQARADKAKTRLEGHRLENRRPDREADK